MTSLTEADSKAFAAVEDALRTYPAADAPVGFNATVMARLRQVTPRPRFRLTWIDYAVGVFCLVMAGAVSLAWQLLPPQAAAYFELKVLWLAQYLRLGPAWLESAWPLAIAAGLGLAGAMLLAAAVLFVRRRVSAV
jgi:hypothetical protein